MFLTRHKWTSWGWIEGLTSFVLTAQNDAAQLVFAGVNRNWLVCYCYPVIFSDYVVGIETFTTVFHTFPCLTHYSVWTSSHLWTELGASSRPASSHSLVFAQHSLFGGCLICFLSSPLSFAPKQVKWIHKGVFFLTGQIDPQSLTICCSLMIKCCT